MPFTNSILQEQEKKELPILRTPEQLVWPLWLENMLYGTEDNPSKYFAELKKHGVELDKAKKNIPKKVKVRLVQIKKQLESNKRRGDINKKTFDTLWGQFYKQVAVDYAERWMRVNEHKIEAMKGRKDTPKIKVPFWLDKMMGGKEGKPSQFFLNFDDDTPGDFVVDYSKPEVPAEVETKIVSAVKGLDGTKRLQRFKKVRQAIWSYYIQQIIKGEEPSIEAPAPELAAPRVLPLPSDKIAGRGGKGLPAPGSLLGSRHPVFEEYLMVGRIGSGAAARDELPASTKLDWMAISPYKIEKREGILVVVNGEEIVLKNNPKTGDIYGWTHPSVPDRRGRPDEEPEEAGDVTEPEPEEAGGKSVEAYLNSIPAADKAALENWPRAKKQGGKWTGGTWTKLISILSLPEIRPSRGARKKLKAAIKEALGLGNVGVPRGKNYVEELVQNAEIQKLMPFFEGMVAGAETGEAGETDETDTKARTEIFVSDTPRHPKMQIMADDDYIRYPPRGQRDPLTIPSESAYVEGYSGFDGSGRFSEMTEEFFGYDNFAKPVDDELKRENPKEYRRRQKENANKEFKTAWAQYVNENRSDVRRKRQSEEGHWSGATGPSFHPVHVGMAFKEFFQNAKADDYVAMVIITTSTGNEDIDAIFKAGEDNTQIDNVIKSRKGFFGVDNSKSTIGKNGTLYTAMKNPAESLDDPTELIDKLANKASEKFSSLLDYTVIPIVNINWELIGRNEEQEDFVEFSEASGDFAVLDDLGISPDEEDYTRSLRFGIPFERKITGGGSIRVTILPKNKSVLTFAENILAKRTGAKTDFKLKIDHGGAGSL